ncbi:hypothetical protein HOLleu_11277 [Holothuria leucospilota]|uniref:Uncharacterized protein n=1 Tax=Holothuria leucospilota TaxID=206669 RepID=A0A9Q1HFG5_HOLLE|nr:hypothetical protein HOLleu_11277 [Holothuria leucospilota]
MYFEQCSACTRCDISHVTQPYDSRRTSHRNSKHSMVQHQHTLTETGVQLLPNAPFSRVQANNMKAT